MDFRAKLPHLPFLTHKVTLDSPQLTRRVDGHALEPSPRSIRRHIKALDLLGRSPMAQAVGVQNADHGRASQHVQILAVDLGIKHALVRRV